MLNKLRLRLIEESDRAFLYALFASTRDDLALLDASVRDSIVEMQWRAQQAQYEATWPTVIDQLILLDGESVGHLLVARTAAETRLVDVSLLPEHRGQGIGAQLLDDLTKKNAGSLPVRLSVVIDNPAKRLYERAGFEVTGRTATHFEMEYRPA